jgi:hypothetical protein
MASRRPRAGVEIVPSNIDAASKDCRHIARGGSVIFLTIECAKLFSGFRELVRVLPVECRFK